VCPDNFVHGIHLEPDLRSDIRRDMGNDELMIKLLDEHDWMWQLSFERDGVADAKGWKYSCFLWLKSMLYHCWLKIFYCNHCGLLFAVRSPCPVMFGADIHA
jgi:hypothetical protein